jgi:hypothetical protein
MRHRADERYRPGLESLEAKQPLSAGLAAGAEPAEVSIAAVQPRTGFLVFRITNPNIHNNTMLPPFGQTLVQQAQPIPGDSYNILSVIVRNGTRQTFTAASGFQVKLAGQTEWTPALTGDQTWAPGQRYVFYVLTKKYYPIKNQVTGGFLFKLGGAVSTAIPGPSGIFLRIKYDPALFPQQLDAIVAFGQGAQGGAGVRTGIAVTNIYEFVNAKTRRNDFGGYF